jgi:hypothetical protein
MNEQPNTTGAMLSEDQRAIAEYFASATYRRRSTAPTHTPDQAWVLDSVMLDHDVVPTTSLCWGLLGLIGILAFFGFLMPLEIKLVEEFFNTGRPMFAMQSILFQTLLFPPAISFSFATVTPMFWYGSIVLRFAIAALMVFPGCVAFYLAASWADEFSSHDFWMGFACVMFAHFLTAGTIALTIQMWSPWALSHARPRGAPLPALGTRAMMELTVIAAVGFAVIVSIDSSKYTDGIIFFAVLGCLSSLAVISALIAFLREGSRNYHSAIISAVLAFGSACLLTGFLAVVEFGWQSLIYEAPFVAAVSLYGAVLICAIMWLCLWWLRSCGWSCINRRESKPD